jgi:hypothetical protein
MEFNFSQTMEGQCILRLAMLSTDGRGKIKSQAISQIQEHLANTDQCSQKFGEACASLKQKISLLLQE